MSVQVVIQTVYFPRAGEAPPEPVPYVLTAAELVRFVRLDEAGTKHPERTLQAYRDRGVLRGVKVGNDLRYTLPEALEFLDRLRGK